MEAYMFRISTLVLDANPLQNIRNSRRINSVWIAGRRLAAMGTN